MNRNSPKATKLRDRLREVVHDEILVAAEEEFARQGLHKARMENIASRAGVAVGTLYNHFQDRDTLLSALLGARRGELCERLDAALASSQGRPFREQLRAFTVALLEHFDAHRPFLSIVLQNELAGCAVAGAQAGAPSLAIREVHRRAEALVKKGLAEKALRRSGSEMFPTYLVGLARSSLLYDIFAGDEDRKSARHSEALVTFFLEGAQR